MPVTEPFIIHHVDGRYLIFETEVLKHLREVHHICGVLIGTLPQISQQNVFLGLPQQIMLEEAAYLVRHEHAYVVDDRKVHRDTVAAITPDELRSHRHASVRVQAQKDAALRSVQLQKKREALEKRGLSHLIQQMSLDDTASITSDVSSTVVRQVNTQVDTASKSIIFKPPVPPGSDDQTIQPNPPEARYQLFSHLHEKDYYLTPGLRFGAQYVAYPGDPLRFHSHFVASGHDWDTPIPMMDFVSGGRLGTGVKKAWLIGGKSPEDDEVKCFTVEWSGM